MGGTSWSDNAYRSLSSSYSSKSRDQIFTSNKNHAAPAEMIPTESMVRESRDSDTHPETFGIGVFLDVTGSMGKIPEFLVREKLGHLMGNLNAHGVTDGQILFGAIGDHISDRAPIQVGQFESGTDELNKWLTSIYLEGNGGGQNMESYLLAWLFMARHTSCDGFEKRGHRGFLFTIGDEATWDKVDSKSLKRHMGYSGGEDMTAEQLLREAERMYHVFHIRIQEGFHGSNDTVTQKWRDLLGERVIMCPDSREVAELIASTVAVFRGIDLDKFTASYDPATATNVKNALAVISKGMAKKDDGGIVAL